MVVMPGRCVGLASRAPFGLAVSRANGAATRQPRASPWELDPNHLVLALKGQNPEPRVPASNPGMVSARWAVSRTMTMCPPVRVDEHHRLQALEAEHSDREHTLEQEVRQATGALLMQSRQLARAERLAAVGAVSVGLAHELRNPLAGIQMACAKLQRSIGDSDQSARLDTVVTDK